MSMKQPPRVWVSNGNPRQATFCACARKSSTRWKPGCAPTRPRARSRPRHILNHFEAKLDEALLFVWDPGTSIAQNPYIEFTFKARRSGRLQLLWRDDQGATLSANKTITVR